MNVQARNVLAHVVTGIRTLTCLGSVNIKNGARNFSFLYLQGAVGHVWLHGPAAESSGYFLLLPEG